MWRGLAGLEDWTNGCFETDLGTWLGVAWQAIHSQSSNTCRSEMVARSTAPGESLIMFELFSLFFCSWGLFLWFRNIFLLNPESYYKGSHGKRNTFSLPPVSVYLDLIILENELCWKDYSEVEYCILTGAFDKPAWEKGSCSDNTENSMQTWSLGIYEEEVYEPFLHVDFKPGVWFFFFTNCLIFYYYFCLRSLLLFLLTLMFSTAGIM